MVHIRLNEPGGNFRIYMGAKVRAPDAVCWKGGRLCSLMDVLPEKMLFAPLEFAVCRGFQVKNV